MLVENQDVKIKWVSANKKWYIKKGYIFTKIWDYFYVKAEDLMPTSKYSVRVVCDYCGEEYVTPFNTYIAGIKTNGKNVCNNCKGNKIRETYDHKLSKNRYNSIKVRCDELGYVLEDDIDDIRTVTQTFNFICPTHGHATLNVSLFLNGAICRKCAVEKNKIAKAEKMKYKVEKEISAFNGNRLLNRDEYINSRTKNLKILCGKCGNVFVSDSNSYLKNARRNPEYACPICNKERFKTKCMLNPDDVEMYINSINNNVLLNKKEYIGNSTSNLKIKCGCCGTVFTTSLSNYQFGKIMCGNCSSKTSYGEYEIKEVLESYNIVYKREYWFPDCRDKNPLPFDFYLPSYNLCIEYQGEQHYREVKIWGGKEGLELRKSHDKIKRDYCINHNIGYFEIPYWERKNIKQLLEKKLGLFNPCENCA